MKYFCIEGIVGSGKTTTLKQLLSSSNKYHCIFEPVDQFSKFHNHNPLSVAYEDPVANAAVAQLHIIEQSISYYTEQFSKNVCDVVVAERSILSPKVFIKSFHQLNIFSDFVHDYLLSFHENLLKDSNLPFPNAYIFLDGDPHLLEERILKRNRKSETKGCHLNLQKILREQYLKFFAQQSVPVVFVPINDKTPDEVVTIVITIINSMM